LAGVLGNKAEEVAGFVGGLEGLVAAYLSTYLHPVVDRSWIAFVVEAPDMSA
jgi:hypothetical protein